jgi:hypothetical protein
MITFNPDRVRANAAATTDDDLLDRVTVQREGMEPEALDIFEEELQRRGIGADRVAAHAERREAEVIRYGDGTVAACSRCPRPAVGETRGWQRLFGVMPFFPRTVRFCEAHRPPGVTSSPHSPADPLPPAG